jgi:glycosyltransferase involved in cell wall biosynthesis
MVVFSNYENLPVVINESFALGVPVVSTRVGGIPEIIDKTNGILISPGNERELEDTLNNYLDSKLNFDKDAILNFAHNKFSSETIGTAIFNLYKSMI